MSLRYTERLAETGLEPSVGSVGDSSDNALAETTIGPFKAEVIHRLGPWRSAEVNRAEFNISRYLVEELRQHKARHRCCSR